MTWHDFLKKSKNHVFGPFFTIFCHYCLMGIFFQKVRLYHTQLYMGPQHHAKFQKKLMSQSQENLLTDGKTDRRMDERTDRLYFIGPFRLRLRLQYIDSVLAYFRFDTQKIKTLLKQNNLHYYIWTI